MTIKSIFLFLGKYLKQNWLRVLLASAGIVIGIWSITLTTMLSFGVSDKIVTAINSQPSARSINIQQEESGATTFFEISGPPKFVSLNKNKTFSEISSIESVSEVSLEENISIFVNNNPEPANNLCTTALITPQQVQAEVPADIPPSFISEDSEATTNEPEQPTQPSPQQPQSIPDECYSINLGITNFTQIYEENKNDWLGKTTAPVGNEVIACYSCNPQKPLYKELGITSPQELVGKTVSSEFVQVPSLLEAGEIFDVTNVQELNKNVTSPQLNELKIVAVIDDSSDNSGAIGAQRNNFYGSESILKTAVDQIDGRDFSTLGFTAYNIYVNDYANLEPTIETLAEKGFLASSPILLVVQAIQTLFLVVSIVLGLFGFIALIASIFGITNVMAISVLKRQKEIGILKSLGATNFDIFKIFSLESLSLGIVGWFIGTVLGYISTLVFAASLERIIANNSGWEQNLLELGITDFNIPFDFRVAIITLIIACIVTLISGLFPALRASRSNPVETLKSE